MIFSYAQPSSDLLNNLAPPDVYSVLIVIVRHLAILRPSTDGRMPQIFYEHPSINHRKLLASYASISANPLKQQTRIFAKLFHLHNHTEACPPFVQLHGSGNPA